jgi:hypothetical protein
MQISLIQQQILIQIERIRDIQRSIMIHTASIPAEELESLLREIRNLYSLGLQLNNENAMQLLNDIQLASKKAMQEIPQPLTQALNESSSFDEKAIEKSMALNKTETTTSEPVKTVQVNVSETKTSEMSNGNKRIMSDIHEMFKETPTLAHTFLDHKTVGEKIAGNESTKRISDHLKSPVRDIKAAIGLNEKFQFINHLFNGDAKKYNIVIDQLNESSSPEMAMNYLKEISDNNNWEMHASSAKSFMDIIERRFSA